LGITPTSWLYGGPRVLRQPFHVTHRTRGARHCNAHLPSPPCLLAHFTRGRRCHLPPIPPYSLHWLPGAPASHTPYRTPASPNSPYPLAHYRLARTAAGSPAGQVACEGRSPHAAPRRNRWHRSAGVLATTPFAHHTRTTTLHCAPASSYAPPVTSRAAALTPLPSLPLNAAATTNDLLPGHFARTPHTTATHCTTQTRTHPHCTGCATARGRTGYGGYTLRPPVRYGFATTLHTPHHSAYHYIPRCLHRRGHTAAP